MGKNRRGGKGGGRRRGKRHDVVIAQKAGPDDLYCKVAKYLGARQVEVELLEDGKIREAVVKFRGALAIKRSVEGGKITIRAGTFGLISAGHLHALYTSAQAASIPELKAFGGATDEGFDFDYDNAESCDSSCPDDLVAVEGEPELQLDIDAI